MTTREIKQLAIDALGKGATANVRAWPWGGAGGGVAAYCASAMRDGTEVNIVHRDRAVAAAALVAALRAMADAATRQPAAPTEEAS